MKMTNYYNFCDFNCNSGNECKTKQYADLMKKKYIYFFLSAWAGKMNQILQSDWFRERAEFSDLERGQRNVNNKKFVMGF